MRNLHEQVPGGRLLGLFAASGFRTWPEIDGPTIELRLQDWQEHGNPADGKSPTVLCKNVAVAF